MASTRFLQLPKTDEEMREAEEQERVRVELDEDESVNAALLSVRLSSRPARLPVHMVLVLDVSSSMRDPASCR